MFSQLPRIILGTNNAEMSLPLSQQNSKKALISKYQSSPLPKIQWIYSDLSLPLALTNMSGPSSPNCRLYFPYLLSWDPSRQAVLNLWAKTPLEAKKPFHRVT